jgi:hypothetical protein
MSEGSWGSLNGRVPRWSPTHPAGSYGVPQLFLVVHLGGTARCPQRFVRAELPEPLKSGGWSLRRRPQRGLSGPVTDSSEAALQAACDGGELFAMVGATWHTPWAPTADRPDAGDLAEWS